VLSPQIFTRTTEWPSLASAHPTGDGGSVQQFFTFYFLAFVAYKPI